MNIFSKKFIYGVIVLIIIGLAFGYVVYGWIFHDNVNDDLEAEYIFIPDGSSYDDIFDILKDQKVLSDPASFDRVADLMKYKKASVKSGRYFIEKHYSNRKIIQVLRSGSQVPINVTFNNVRSIAELSGAVSEYIEPDSLSLLNYLQDPKIRSSRGFDEYNFMTLFIPNTYEFFWNTSKEGFLRRMESEHKKFWTENRLKKAEQLGLSKEEVYILASIVEKESLKESEKDIIAGLYLNRLRRGIKLQADPTVVYGVGDFTIRRVLNKHLAHNSPYNTYMYAGLPPGPICMPNITTIDKTLNAAKHNLIYMCAKPGYGKEHNFAETDKQHVNNANKYRAWLDKEGIMK